MAFRPLKSFFPTADELLQQDLRTLGRVLLTHLKSYEGLNTVYQYAGLNRGYFRAVLENRNVGLGPLPKEPEYGTRQPEVTKRMMEVWNWLEREGLLIHNDQQADDWFIVASEGEEYLAQGKLPAPPSPNHARVSKSAGGVPRAFLSYSWDGPEHQQWVAKFAERLQRKSGVEIIFDRWRLNPGDDKLYFMEQAVADSNFVIVVCTPIYAERANRRQGGVGYESMVITAELAEHVLTNKFIPVLRKGMWASSLPIYLKSRIGVNLSDEPYHEDEYEKLLRVLHGEPIQPPPLGSKPDFSRQPQLPLSAPATGSANALQAAPVTTSPLQRRRSRSGEFLPKLNPKEIELLVSAARDSSGQIGHRKAIGGDQLHVGDRTFLDSRDARSVAEWLGAVRTLVSEDLMEDVGQNGDFYRVTDLGYAVADILADPANANNVTFEFKKVIIKGDSAGPNMPAAISIPLEVLREAIRAVPAVRYALGIAGVIAVIAIVKGFNLDFRIAGFGTIIMLLLMTVLVVFARLTKTAPGPFVVPVAIFTWFAILMTMTVATLLLTSVFWQKPVDLQDWVVKKRAPDPLLPKKGESLAQYLSNGRVVSLEWSREIPTAVWETGSLYRVWYNAGSKTWWATGKLNTQNGGQFRQGSDAATTCPQSPVLTGSHPITTCFSPEDHKIVIWQGDYDFDESGNVLKGQEVVGHIARTS